VAYYENLPIYKKAMELAIYIEKAVRDFTRYHKYTIGTDMRNLSRDIVSLVIKANSRKDSLLHKWQNNGKCHAELVSASNKINML